MLFVRPFAGLCNRLRVINAAVKMSHDLQHKLIIYWQTDPEMNCSFHSLFDKSDDFSVVDCDYKDLYQRVLFHRYNIFFSHSEKDIMSKAFSRRPIAISTCSEFYGQERYGGYEWLKPRKEILDEVESCRASHSADMIGLHIRRTDNAISIKMSPIELFKQKIEEELKKNPGIVFFLATDDKEVKKDLLSTYGNAIFTRENIAQRNDPDGVRDALVDLLLLSKCNKLYGSYWSSFSEEAAKIGNVVYQRLQISEK